MGTTKTQVFSPGDNAVAATAKALAHPARVAILRYLVQQASCVCGDIVDEIGLAQATVSQHLKVLKEAGFIQGNIEGPRVCYCIDPTGWAQGRERIDSVFNQLEGACKNC
jgi:DNA-binding transcriptional ArsR family regulator